VEYNVKTRYFSLSLWILGCLVLAVSVAGTSLVMHSRAGDGRSQEQLPGNSVTASGDGVVCFGHVDVEHRVRNLYPAQLGRVEEVPVHEDDSVKAGTVLLRIDSRPAQFLLRQAQADLKAAQSRLRDAQKLPQQHELQIAQQKQAIAAAKHRLSAAKHARDHKQQLVNKGGYGSEAEVSAAAELVNELEAALRAAGDKLRELELIDPAADILRAEADVAAKQARVDNAQYAVDECSLRAPCDGKVLRILVGPGDMLGSQPKEPAVQFCPQEPRIVRAEVEQEFAGRVALGQAALIQDDSRAGPTWHGKVIRISDWYTHRRSILQEPLQFNDVRTLECLVQLDPHPQTPRIGQRVRVSLGQATAK
jgi:multidrug resistance efflux pump